MAGKTTIGTGRCSIANHHFTQVENRDPLKTNNRRSLAELTSFTPGFDWPAFLAAAGVPATAINVRQPSYFQQLAKMIRSTSIADWRLYYRYHLLNDNAPYLGTAFEAVRFEFYSKALRGIKEPRPRWKRGVQALDGTVGELVGRLYVEKTFTPAAKQRMQELIGNLRAAFAKSIDELDWMSAATKVAAQRKLAAIRVKIGYPDEWRDYSALTVLPGDLLGNLRRANEFEFKRQVAKLGKPLDRNEWLMTPQTVNAYYMPPMNEIVFPAAILHPPFFDPDADDAVNYGSIGAIIGHEISHGFDDSGRQYDGDGNLRDWWTFEDSARFRQRAGRLVTQFANYRVLDGKPLNGELTLGENIGDLSGLAVAFKAYKLSLQGKTASVIDGFTGEQRFFLGFAQAWRENIRDDELLLRLVSDTHSPARFRANGPVSNMNEFYAAFAVKEGDKLYRPEAERVKIW